MRIGIHYGRGDIIFDEVSKGYDYYGNVVNTAARVESSAHGGQLIVSRDFAVAASTDHTKTVEMGAHVLRGVAEPVELIQINVLNRQYPNLRTGAEGGEDGGDDDNFSSTGRSTGSAQTMTSTSDKYLSRNPKVRGELQFMAQTLFLTFSSCPDAMTRDILKQLCSKWHVDCSAMVKKKTKPATDIAVWNLAERLAKVAQAADETKGIKTAVESMRASLLSGSTSGGPSAFRFKGLSPHSPERKGLATSDQQPWTPLHNSGLTITSNSMSNENIPFIPEHPAAVPDHPENAEPAAPGSFSPSDPPLAGQN